MVSNFKLVLHIISKCILYGIRFVVVKFRFLRLIDGDEKSYIRRYLYFKYYYKYKQITKSFPENDNANFFQIKPINVWLFWYQGFDNAPDIVKTCVNCIKKVFKGSKYKINLLTKNNVFDYVNLPIYIEKKFKKKLISFAHYSDIIRTFLLVKYGGYWIDPTVFIPNNSKFFNIVEEQRIFVFKVLDLSGQCFCKSYISNWFIYSVPNEKILSLTLNLLYKYWKKRNKPENYFIYHTLFSISADRFRKEFDNIPTYNNCSPHTLQWEMYNEFNENRFVELLKLSPVHKMNHNWIRPISKQNTFTFYDFIIKNYLN